MKLWDGWKLFGEGVPILKPTELYLLRWKLISPEETIFAVWDLKKKNKLSDKIPNKVSRLKMYILSLRIHPRNSSGDCSLFHSGCNEHTHASAVLWNSLLAWTCGY